MIETWRHMQRLSSLKNCCGENLWCDRNWESEWRIWWQLTRAVSPVATQRDEDKVTWMRKLPGTQIHKIQSGCDKKWELIDFLLTCQSQDSSSWSVQISVNCWEWFIKMINQNSCFINHSFPRLYISLMKEKNWKIMARNPGWNFWCYWSFIILMD